LTRRAPVRYAGIVNRNGSQAAGIGLTGFAIPKLAFFRLRNISKNFVTLAKQRDHPTPASVKEPAASHQLRSRMNDL
jgi:hypothetical protein